MEVIKDKDKNKNDLRQKLMLIVYNGIFSNPNMYEKAIDFYRHSSCTSIPNAIALLCRESADAFLAAMSKNDDDVSETW